jgi:hypothetical protein
LNEEIDILRALVAGPLTIRPDSAPDFDAVARLCLRLYRQGYVFEARYEMPSDGRVIAPHPVTMHGLTGS